MEKNMAFKDYWRNEVLELNIWKLKLSNAIRKMDMAKAGAKRKRYMREIDDLNILLDILMGELEDRVESLHTSFPTDRKPDYKEIKVKPGNLSESVTERSLQRVKVNYDYGG